MNRTTHNSGAFCQSGSFGGHAERGTQSVSKVMFLIQALNFSLFQKIDVSSSQFQTAIPHALHAGLHIKK